MNAIICISAMKDCINPDSYGEICVRCNACGRGDKATQKECGLKLYKRLLQEQHEFDNWHEGSEELQEKNRLLNIKYFEDKIRELEGLTKESEV